MKKQLLLCAIVLCLATIGQNALSTETNGPVSGEGADQKADDKATFEPRAMAPGQQNQKGN